MTTMAANSALPNESSLPDPSEIRGLLIDMDGTLINHMETLARCFQYACRTLGYPEPSLDVVTRSVGGSMPVTIQKFLPEQKVQEGIRLWSEHFEEIHLENLDLLPGAEALLDRCQATDRIAAIFTNKTGRHTRAILQKLGLSPKLAFALGAEDTPYRKPQPEFSHYAIKRLGLPPSAIAMIGDSHFDIQAAQAGGMIPLCVTTGSHTRSELESAGAALVFESLAEIATWLEGSQASQGVRL